MPSPIIRNKLCWTQFCTQEKLWIHVKSTLMHCSRNPRLPILRNNLKWWCKMCVMYIRRSFLSRNKYTGLQKTKVYAYWTRILYSHVISRAESESKVRWTYLVKVQGHFKLRCLGFWSYWIRLHNMLCSTAVARDHFKVKLRKSTKKICRFLGLLKPHS